MVEEAWTVWDRDRDKATFGEFTDLLRGRQGGLGWMLMRIRCGWIRWSWARVARSVGMCWIFEVHGFGSAIDDTGYGSGYGHGSWIQLGCEI